MLKAAEDEHAHAEKERKILAELVRVGAIALHADVDHHVAENGEVAVERFSAQPAGHYDFILMDVQMPVMDGYMATKKIRSLEDSDLANIPIIALSANAFEEDRKASTDAGMNGHLAKPVNVSELLKMLCKLL